MSTKLSTFSYSLKFLAKRAILFIVAGLYFFIAPSFAFSAEIQIYATVSLTQPYYEVIPGQVCEESPIETALRSTHMRYASLYSSDLYQSDGIGNSTDICERLNGLGYSFPSYTVGNGDYYIVASSTISADVYYVKLYYNSGVITTDESYVDTTTHIETVTPAGNSTVATSTAFVFSATGYINNDDLKNGVDVEMKWTLKRSQLAGCIGNNWSSAICALPDFGDPFTTHIATSGVFTVSTTTDMQGLGQYFLTVKVFRSKSWLTEFFLGEDLLVSTSTDFTLATSSLQDSIDDDQTNALLELAGAVVGGTVEACKIDFSLKFDLLRCIASIFIPNKNQMRFLIDQASDGFLSYAPFGYVRRFYDIVIGNEVASLPSLAITIPVGFPGAGAELDMTPWGKLMGPGSLLATATSTVSGKTFFGGFIDYWKTFVYFTFGLAIILELIGLNGVMSFSWGSSGKNGGRSKGDDVKVVSFDEVDKKRMLRDLYKK